MQRVEHILYYITNEVEFIYFIAGGVYETGQGKSIVYVLL